MYYVGEIRTFAFNFRRGTPSALLLLSDGWLPCDGRVLLRAEYKALFDAIDVTWGAPDDLSFCVPGLSGSFQRGVTLGNGPSQDPDPGTRSAPRPDLALSGASGGSVGSFQTDLYAEHHHGYQVHRDPPAPNAGRGNVLHAGVTYPDQTTTKGGAETRPRNHYVLWMVFSGRKIAATNEDLPAPHE